MKLNIKKVKKIDHETMREEDKQFIASQYFWIHSLFVDTVFPVKKLVLRLDGSSKAIIAMI